MVFGHLSSLEKRCLKVVLGLEERCWRAGEVVWEVWTAILGIWKATVGGLWDHLEIVGGHLGHIVCHPGTKMQAKSQPVDFPYGF